MMPLLRRWWGDHKATTIAFAVASALIPALYLSFFPSMGDVKNDMLSAMPEAFRRIFNMDAIGTGAGWAHMTVYSLIGLFVMIAAAVTWGSRAIAGAEEDGTLELTLAHGVSRRRVLWERALAVFGQVLLLNLVVAAVVLLLDGPMGLDLTLPHLVAQHGAYLALVVTHAALALGIGAITGRRGLAVAVSAGVFFAGYIFSSLANYLPDWGWLRLLSTMDWAYRWKPLTTGWDLLGIGLLLAVSALVMAVAHWRFTRRDISG